MKKSTTPASNWMDEAALIEGCIASMGEGSFDDMGEGSFDDDDDASFLSPSTDYAIQPVDRGSTSATGQRPALGADFMDVGADVWGTSQETSSCLARPQLVNASNVSTRARFDRAHDFERLSSSGGALRRNSGEHGKWSTLDEHSGVEIWSREVSRC